MELLPEQIAVLEYLKRRGTDADAQVLIDEFRDTVDAAYVAFSRVPPALRLLEPAPGKWSPQEILDHVIECHRCAPAQLERIAAGLPGDETIRAYVQSSNPLAHPWRSMLHDFRAMHHAMAATATALASGDHLHIGAPMELVVRLQEAPRTRDVEWTATLDWKAYLAALRVHLKQHIAQLERTLEEVAP